MAHKNNVQRRTVRVTLSEPVYQAMQKQADLIGLSAASYMALATREYMQRDQLIQALRLLDAAQMATILDPDDPGDMNLVTTEDLATAVYLHNEAQKEGGDRP